MLKDAEHGAFRERAPPGEGHARSPNRRRVSTAFLDSFLLGNSEARTWLDGDGPRSVQEKDDRWRWK